MKRIIILGGEGNGGVFASCIEKHLAVSDKSNDIILEGYLNDYLKLGDLIGGYPVLGPLSDTKKFSEHEDFYFIWAIHPVGKGKTRESVYNELNLPAEKFYSYVSPQASVSKSSKLDHGVFIMDNCYIGPRAEIGSNCFVMANSVVGHDTSIGKCCHISAGANISSYVRIGNFSDICIGATILENKKIGNFSVAGAGSMIVKDIGDNEVHFGNPGKFIRVAASNT